MEMELNRSELIAHINRQLANNFGFCGDIEPYLDITLERAQRCFKASLNKYYQKNEEEYFSPYHSGQYAVFLYYLANTIKRVGGDENLATKIYYLNKIMHSVDWYYEIELPEYWGVEHPMSSVLGRAKYNNGFFFYQGCTVGGNKGKYPEMGKNVILYSNVTVLGDAKIGDNVVISTGTTIKDETIPGSCLVFGHSPNLIIKLKDEQYMDELISHFWVR
ncbi:serine acetyltransferase [Desulfitobacterium dichloroeliminans LMG P-21439]|uniref:Serine acetyltransferase n=1 Tax=Desulfitobacterium dichloroeliminans (strain LMG P-21439 / DCA1) TaxID=871963 RepID=L0FBL8_DESDL|nr:transferase [Desulfitobacterium dichloroeliminans]AGA70607.1 serine acetyltransferase [Desulfitobacterium dichloroeliminans LMG P-21439]